LQKSSDSSLFRSLVIPWTLILIVFFPVFQGKTPLNLDWLTVNHYPWKAVSSSKISNPDIDDPAVEFFPLAHRAATVLRQGRIPLWNPDIGCGSPQLADFISQPLDPLFLISTFATQSSPFTWALLLLLQQIVLALAVAGFLLARRCSTLGASIGATAVVFSAPVINWMELRRFSASFICFFLVLWAIERNRQRPQLLVALSGTALAYGGLAGHPQFTLYVWILSACYLFYRTISDRKFSSVLILIVSTFVLGSLLCSSAVIPQLELLKEATRGEPGRYFSMFRFGAAPWISFVVPDFLGHPVSRDYFGGYIYYRSYTTLPILYFGALPLTIILFSLRRKISGKGFFVYISVGLLGFLTIAGIRPVRFWLNDHLTGLFSIDPGRSAMLATILLAAWSGEAATHLFNGNSRSLRKNLLYFYPLGVITALIGIISAALHLWETAFVHLAGDNSLLLYLLKLQKYYGVLFMAPSIRLAWTAFAMAGLVIYLGNMLGKYKTLMIVLVGMVLGADLLPQAMKFNSFLDPAVLELPDQYKNIFKNNSNALYRSTGVDRTKSGIAESEIFPPNTLLYSNISDFRTYSSTPLAAHTGLINAVQQRTYWDRSIKPSIKPLLNIASVKWFYTSPGFFEFEPQIPDKILPGLKAYVNKTVLPRLRVTGYSLFNEEREETSPEKMYNYVWSWLELYPSRFKYQTILFASQSDPAIENLPDYADGTVISSLWNANEIQAEVSTETSAVAVVSDAWYPGWKAFVNNKPAQIYRANGMFRAVVLVEGLNKIIFRYEPVSYRLGLFFSMIGLMMMFSMIFMKNGKVN